MCLVVLMQAIILPSTLLESISGRERYFPGCAKSTGRARFVNGRLWVSSRLRIRLRCMEYFLCPQLTRLKR
jgi:hypothetical protein